MLKKLYILLLTFESFEGPGVFGMVLDDIGALPDIPVGMTPDVVSDEEFELLVLLQVKFFFINL